MSNANSQSNKGGQTSDGCQPDKHETISERDALRAEVERLKKDNEEAHAQWHEWREVADALEICVQDQGEIETAREAAEQALDELLEQTRVSSPMTGGSAVLANVMRERYGRSARQWQANHDLRVKERDEARARLALIEPVFEAARAWRHVDFNRVNNRYGEEIALVSAIDAAERKVDYEVPTHEPLGPSRPARSVRCTCSWRSKDHSETNPHAPECAINVKRTCARCHLPLDADGRCPNTTPPASEEDK